MKKILILLPLFLLVLVTTGCGHNTVLHSKGWGIDISWNQDSMIPNLRLGYWDVSTAMVRENVEVDMTSTAGLTANAGKKDNSVAANTTAQNTTGKNTMSTQAGGNAGNTIKITTGPQVNGYTKDVLTNAGATQQNVNLAKALFNVKQNTQKKQVKSKSTSTATESTAKITTTSPDPVKTTK